MNPKSLALINIEAEAQDRKLMSTDTVEKLAFSLGVAPKIAALPNSGPVDRKALLISGDSISTQAEEAVLLNALSTLPSAVNPKSFAWEAVKGPADVESLMKAVMVYHRFNVQAVAISERIGANDDFRRFIRQCPMPEAALVSSAIEREQRNVDRISTFRHELSAFVEVADRVFGGEEWNIASMLVLTAAARGMLYSRDLLSKGWNLPALPSTECLDEFEALRMQLAFASSEVKEKYGLNLLGYSQSSLSGIRRSLFDGGADFVHAIRVFGVSINDEEHLIEVARLVRGYLEAWDSIERLMKDWGYEAKHMQALMANVLIRKYLKAAADAVSVEWETVREILIPKALVEPDEIKSLIAALDADGFSAKLEIITKDRQQSISNVLYAAEHYTVTRRYWIDAGTRVVDYDPGIRLMDLRSILELEPEIHGNSEILTKVGAFTRADVEELEAHLEWMLCVYALPISNSAIKRIIDSRGDVLKDKDAPSNEMVAA